MISIARPGPKAFSRISRAVDSPPWLMYCLAMAGVIELFDDFRGLFLRDAGTVGDLQSDLFDLRVGHMAVHLRRNLRPKGQKPEWRLSSAQSGGRSVSVEPARLTSQPEIKKIITRRLSLITCHCFFIIR